MLAVGDRVPDFVMASDSAGSVAAKALRGTRYLVYFYPKDDTPGCTKEACAFRDNLPAFKDLGVPVYGVSADDLKAHGKFVQKYQLNFPLLTADQATLEAFGVWVEKSMYGKKYFGIARASFVIGADGVVEMVWPKVSPEGHAAEVLAYLGGAATAAPAKATRPKAPAKPKAATVKPAASKAAIAKVKKPTTRKRGAE